MSVDKEVDKLLEQIDSDGDFDVPLTVDSKFYIVDTSDGSEPGFEDRSALQIYGTEKEKNVPEKLPPVASHRQTPSRSSSGASKYPNGNKRSIPKTFHRYEKSPDFVRVPKRFRSKSRDRDFARHRPDFRLKGRLGPPVILKRRSRSRSRSRKRSRSRGRKWIRSRSRSRSRDRHAIRSRSRSRSRNRPRSRNRSRSRSTSRQRIKIESKRDKKREFSLTPPGTKSKDWRPDSFSIPPPLYHEQNYQKYTESVPLNNLYYVPPAVSMPAPQPVPPPQYFNAFPTFETPAYPEYNYASAAPPQVSSEYPTYEVPPCPDITTVDKYKENLQRKELVLNKCSEALQALSEPHLPNILFGDPNHYSLKSHSSLPNFVSPMNMVTSRYKFTTGKNQNRVLQNICSLLDLNPFLLERKEFSTRETATETDTFVCEKCSIISTKPTRTVSTFTDIKTETRSIHSQVNTDELATIKLFKSNNSESNSSKGKSLMHMTAAEILTASEKPPHGDYSNPYLTNQQHNSSRSTSTDFGSSNNSSFNRHTQNEVQNQPRKNYKRDSPSIIEQNLKNNQRNLSNASISSKPMMKNASNLPLSLLLSSLCKSSNRPNDSN